MHRWRRAIRIVLLVLLQLGATVLLVEAGLRLVRPWHHGLRTLLYLPTVRTHFDAFHSTSELLALTTLGYSPGRESHGFVLNSRGFRTHEYAFARAPGLRIVALGDSFTFGAVPYQDTWPVRLESRLEQHLGERSGRAPVEVLSLGVPGVGPEFYLRLWELEGLRLRPDLVVLGFFVGNDLIEEAGHELDASPHGPLLEHSLLVRAVRNGVRILRTRRLFDLDRLGGGVTAAPAGAEVGVELPDFAATFDPLRPTFPEDFYLDLEWSRLAICRREERDFLLARLTKVRQVLGELHQSVRAVGAELVVLLIPDEFQVDDDLLERLLEKRGYPPDRLALGYPQRRLKDFFDRFGWRYLDVLPAFRKRAPAERLYRVQDSHWNAAGNELGAALLAEYLIGAGLVSPEE